MASISSLLPVGSYMYSALTEAQFQAEAGAEWVLCDGRTAAGTRYNAITGASNIPDARSMILKGKMNGRADAFADPDGETALGTQQADRNKFHDHGFNDPGHTHALNMFTATGGFGGFGPPAGSNLTAGTANSNTTGITFSADGSSGEDSRPNSLIANLFFKIN